MATAIEVQGLVKAYGGRKVVDGLDLSVEQGEVFALLGPNGAGKTTTVEILEGLRSADAGSVRVLGLDPARQSRKLRPRIGVMPQEPAFYSGARPPESLRLLAAFYPDPMDPARLLADLGLEHTAKTTWRRLSGGERQRLSLAMALIGRPELLFLDEPTAGMDAHARVATWELVRGLRSEGVTVLLTTHLLEEAERLADRVAILHRGNIRAAGTPSELASGAGDGRQLSFRAGAGLDTGQVAAAVGGEVTEQSSGRYVVTGIDPTPELVAKLTTWMAERQVRLEDLTVGSRSLEQVFLELTAEETG